MDHSGAVEKKNANAVNSAIGHRDCELRFIN